MNGNGGTPEDGARAARAVVRVRDTNREVRDAAFARPQEYDESGFPITGQPPSFADRVRRLIFG
jgi:hypothetical protein